MSMITGCPACGTLFKVVPDQLKISDGWVRCGHCSEVFDATAPLRGDEEVAAPAAAGPLDTEPQPLAATPPVAEAPAGPETEESDLDAFYDPGPPSVGPASSGFHSSIPS